MASERTMRLMTQSESFAYVEAYKALRTNVKFMAGASDNAKVIMITSSQPAEGKSNVSINLAVALAEDGEKVVLLDCDFRKGTMQRYLKVPRQSPGLTSFLIGEAKYDSIVHHFQNLKIDLLPAGFVPPNPSELLGSRQMGKLLEVLSHHYDYIICDTAPVNAVSDAVALARYADGAILVVSYNDVTRQSAIAARKQLEASNVTILGAVLNMYDARDTNEMSHKYSYYNYKSYGEYGYDTEVTGSDHRSHTDHAADTAE